MLRKYLFFFSYVHHNTAAELCQVDGKDLNRLRQLTNLHKKLPAAELELLDAEESGVF